MLDFLLAAVLFGGLLLVLEAAFRIGRRARKVGGEEKVQSLTLQSAAVGLMSLLLGFSFAGAQGRWVERQHLIAREANAIGTAYLRADLLGEPHRTELRALLRNYAAARIAFFVEDRPEQSAARTESERLHPMMWNAAAAGVRAAPQFTMAVLPPLNEVIDLNATQLAVIRRRVPPAVLTLLIACALAALSAVGYGCGAANQRSLVSTTALAFLVAATLWTILDLDHPQRGLARVNSAPLLDLLRSGLR